MISNLLVDAYVERFVTSVQNHPFLLERVIVVNANNGQAAHITHLLDSQLLLFDS